MLSADTRLCAPQAETLAFRTDSYKEGRETSWNGLFRRATRRDKVGGCLDPPTNDKNHELSGVRELADHERF